MRAPVTSLPARVSPDACGAAGAAAWCGARTVKRMPCVGQDLEGLEVDGGLRQPHALGLAAEAALEVADAPDAPGSACRGALASGMIMWL